MQATYRLQARQSQRGISNEMVNYVVAHGIEEKDGLIFEKKLALKRLAEIREEERLIKKILDKGGVIVVAQGNTLITTYNYN